MATPNQLKRYADVRDGFDGRGRQPATNQRRSHAEQVGKEQLSRMLSTSLRDVISEKKRFESEFHSCFELIDGV